MVPLKNVEDTVLARFVSNDEADIELEEYWIFINEESKTITLKWEGEYADTRTYNIDEVNEKESDPKKHVTLEQWVVRKVADIQVKFLGKRGHIREIVIDRYGVIDKILEKNR